MLETYTLKKHLEDVRQELAHALYQHDAACRVIARLMKERDAARKYVPGLMLVVVMDGIAVQCGWLTLVCSCAVVVLRSALGDTQSNMAAAANMKDGSAAPAASAAAMEMDDAGMSKIVSAKMVCAVQWADLHAIDRSSLTDVLVLCCCFDHMIRNRLRRSYPLTVRKTLKAPALAFLRKRNYRLLLNGAHTHLTVHPNRASLHWMFDRPIPILCLRAVSIVMRFCSMQKRVKSSIH